MLCTEHHSNRGQGTGSLLHHASQQNLGQTTSQLLGHAAEAEGLHHY